MTTETPMRERIARAICQSGKFDCGEGRCAVLCMDSLGEKPKECAYAKRLHGALADAVLDAMRKPTDAQIKYAVELCGCAATTGTIWRTMIDAAKEGE